MRKAGFVALAVLVLGLAPQDVADATTGDLTQTGCVNVGGSGGCSSGTALANPSRVAVSPDGASVYAIANDALLVFDRVMSGPNRGAIIQKASTDGCFTASTVAGCTTATGIGGPTSILVSPDNKSVYVTSLTSDAIAVFTRAADGSLFQISGTSGGCISQDGASVGCRLGIGLDDPRGVAVSADGRSVYVASSTSDSIAVFDRATENGTVSLGTLTQKTGSDGCIAETTAEGCTDGFVLDGAFDVAISRDGKSVYAAAHDANGVAVLDRVTTSGGLTEKACVKETGAGGCADGTGLIQPTSVALSTDGTSVYVASPASNGVAIFNRKSDGSIKQQAGTAGCISDDGTSGACTDGRALLGASFVAVSPDLKSVYAVAPVASAIVIFDRKTSGPARGKLTERSGGGGCFSDAGTDGCTDGNALSVPAGLAMNPRGDSLYVASYNSSALATFSRQASSVSCSFAIPTRTGTNGSDELTGTSADDIIFGLGGADRLNGEDGYDVLCGSGGNDKLFGGPGNDVLDGGGGTNDRCFGEDGTDLFHGCEVKKQ